jgi:hypothetical protein
MALIGDSYGPQINIAVLADENQISLVPRNFCWNGTQGLDISTCHTFSQSFKMHLSSLTPSSLPPSVSRPSALPVKLRPTQSSVKKPVSEREGVLKSDHLQPGAAVSVDHFESRFERKYL